MKNPPAGPDRLAKYSPSHDQILRMLEARANRANSRKYQGSKVGSYRDDLDDALMLLALEAEEVTEDMLSRILTGGNHQRLDDMRKTAIARGRALVRALIAKQK